MRDDGPYRLKTFRAAVLRDILVRVPEAIRLIGVVEVDDVDRPDPRFIERDVVVEDLLPLLVRKLTYAEGCGGVPHESDDIRRVPDGTSFFRKIEELIAYHIEKNPETGDVIGCPLRSKVA